MGERRRYRVSGALTISVSTVVTAETPERAREIAKRRGVVSLCHQCAAGEEAEEWVTSGELDGEPVDVEVGEEER